MNMSSTKIFEREQNVNILVSSKEIHQISNNVINSGISLTGVISDNEVAGELC